MNVIRLEGTDPSVFSREELKIYKGLSEGQLLHFYEPKAGLFIAESPNVILRALDAGYEPVSFLMEEEKIGGAAAEVLQKAGDVPVYTAEPELLKNITGFYLTRGILCAMKRHPLPDPALILRSARRVAVLEEIENPTNVGAIFRSAAALGMDAVLLTPGCSDPLYRRSARVSMGTVFQVPWTFLSHEPGFWPEKGMALLRAHGFQTAAMALSDDSVPVDDPAVLSAEKLALVLGTEGDGLKRETIAGCDLTVRIPMQHGVDSLNVAAAAAVAFYVSGKRTEG